MSTSSQNQPPEPVAVPPRPKPSGQSSLVPAFLLGIPMAAGLLLFLRLPMWNGTLVERYTSHPVECVEIVIFCCALAALLVKLLGYFRQRMALRWELLPEWDGEAIPASEANGLMAHLSRLPRRVQRSWVGQRFQDILSYVCRRRSAEELDDHIRALSDNDMIQQENSYSLIRFLIWSMPILGFLGTVLGIAGAIAGVSPEVLEKSIGTVTQGLALAFDTTGLALILTIVTMFLSFMVERLEQGARDLVDSTTDLHLSHRFARPQGENGPVIEAVEQSAQAVMASTDRLVQRQADLWAESLTKSHQQLLDAEKSQQQRFTQALEEAMSRSLVAHQQKLAEMQQQMEAETGKSLQPLTQLAENLEQQQAALQPIAKAMQALGQALLQLQKQEGQLNRMQQLLQQNLSTLASTGSFEQAVHSLSAAIHLLTAKTTAPSLRLVSEEEAA